MGNWARRCLRAEAPTCALLWLPRGDEVASVECGKTDLRRTHADPDERTHRRPVEGSRLRPVRGG
jgi:hypothetical protein